MLHGLIETVEAKSAPPGWAIDNARVGAGGVKLLFGFGEHVRAGSVHFVFPSGDSCLREPFAEFGEDLDCGFECELKGSVPGWNFAWLWCNGGGVVEAGDLKVAERGGVQYDEVGVGCGLGFEPFGQRRIGFESK